MLWGDLEFVIFLSNCTAPIYCNVIKNSYCEFLSQFAFSLPRISVPHLCNGVSHELHVWQWFSVFLVLVACHRAVVFAHCCSLPLRGGAAALWQNALSYWSISSGPCCFCIPCWAEPHFRQGCTSRSLVRPAWPVPSSVTPQRPCFH